MSYKITFYNEFDEVIGTRIYEDTYYKTLSMKKLEIIVEVNRASYSDLIMTDTGAVRKSKIDHFNIEEC